jgi:hypothetical protein
VPTKIDLNMRSPYGRSHAGSPGGGDHSLGEAQETCTQRATDGVASRLVTNSMYQPAGISPSPLGTWKVISPLPSTVCAANVSAIERCSTSVTCV